MEGAQRTNSTVVRNVNPGSLEEMAGWICMTVKDEQGKLDVGAGYVSTRDRVLIDSGGLKAGGGTRNTRPQP
jgi:hypothetical protein